MKPDALFLYRDGCAMTMLQGSFGTLHDLVSTYSKNAQPMPQLVAMHYAIEVIFTHSVPGLHSYAIVTAC